MFLNCFHVYCDCRIWFMNVLDYCICISLPHSVITLSIQWWLFSSTSIVIYPLATRLWKLHIDWPTSLSSATTPVCAQPRSSTGVPASTLRRTTSLTPLQSSTNGCVYQNGSTRKLRSWRCYQLVHVADLPGRHPLRSSSSHQLQVPANRLTTVDRRSFPVAASILWNSLPPDIQSCSSLTCFCQRLRHTCSTSHFQKFLL